MTKDELITKQQLIIEDYKQKSVHNEAILRALNFRIIGIGQPLNDNILKMTKDQLHWVFEVNELIEKIEI